MTSGVRIRIVLASMALIAVATASVIQAVAQTAAPATAPAAATPPPASPAALAAEDGRLGGTRGSFERAYGGPILEVPTILYPVAYAYQVKGFGSFEVFYDQDQALAIQLVSPRDQHKRGYAPDPADWSLATAQDLALRYLPADTHTDPAQRTAQGNLLTPCFSQSLAAAVKASTYAAYRLQGQPGACQFTLYLTSAGRVFAIDIGLGDEARSLAPLELPATFGIAPATAAATPAAAAPTNLSPAERTYVNTVKAQIAEIRTSVTQFNQLINTPKPNDATWSKDLNNVLTSWQSLYTNAKSMQPPPRLVAFHATYVHMLSLLAGAAGDISAGISNNDAALINAAGINLQQAFAILNTLDDELNKALS